MKKIAPYLLAALFLAGCVSDESPNNQLPIPTPDFTASSTDIDTGSSVTFTNTSTNATSYSWVFQGGNPPNSTDEDPTVTYSAPGLFPVSLTAINGPNDNTLTRADYILVTDPVVFETATYQVTFTGNWSQTNHPTEFPAGDHFSSAVGMVHKMGASFFQPGAVASPGVEEMAEQGVNGMLSAEISDLINTDMAFDYVEGGGLSTGTSERTFDIFVTEEFPLVTLVSMIVPSPDWFIAVENVALFTGGAFLETLTVNAISYDAGTDSGTTFTSANDDTDPAGNIMEITQAPLGNGTTVDPPMATFTFEKIDP